MLQLLIQVAAHDHMCSCVSLYMRADVFVHTAYLWIYLHTSIHCTLIQYTSDIEIYQILYLFVHMHAQTHIPKCIRLLHAQTQYTKLHIAYTTNIAFIYTHRYTNTHI